MAKKESNEQKKTIWEKLGLDAGGDLQKRQTLVVGGIGVALIVTIIVVALIIRAVNQPTTFVKETDLSKPSRNVERKYLDAADGLISSVSKTDASKDLETSLAYTWANHQYWLATGDEKHLEAALDGLNISESKLPTKNTEIPELGTSPENLGLVCVMLKDVYEDARVKQSLKDRAAQMCAQASDDYWESDKMREYHERLAKGQQEKQANKSAIFHNDPEYIAQELNKMIKDKLKGFLEKREFTWMGDEETEFWLAHENMRRQLLAANNKFYRTRVYEQVDFTDDSPAAQALRQQRERDVIDWLYLLGQSLAWYVNYDDYSEEMECMLYQTLTAYLRSDMAGDIFYLEEMAYTSPLTGYQTGVCQVLAFANYDSNQDSFDRERNYLSSDLVDEATTNGDRLYLAGLLTQEEQAQTAPALTVDGTDIDTYEFELPEGFENIWNEITLEDLEAVRALHADYDENAGIDETDYTFTEKQQQQLDEDVAKWESQLSSPETIITSPQENVLDNSVVGL